MRIGIATFAQQMGQQPGQVDPGSTRIRVRWPLRYWPEAEEFRIGCDYDVVIFQKAYWLECASQYAGLKILDLCDPDFLDDGPRCLAMMDRCDAISCSSPSLTEHVATLTRTPVCTIPDRVDLASIGERLKEHSGPTTTVAWYGHSQNLPLLDLGIEALLQHHIARLLVISDAVEPYVLPSHASGRIALTYRRWREETVYDDLLTADVVLNPRCETGRWRFKSANKTVLAWALGLPVARTTEELGRLLTEEERRSEADRRREEVRTRWDVRATVAEYRQLIAQAAKVREHDYTHPV